MYTLAKVGARTLSRYYAARNLLCNSIRTFWHFSDLRTHASLPAARSNMHSNTSLESLGVGFIPARHISFANKVGGVKLKSFHLSQLDKLATETDIKKTPFDIVNRFVMRVHPDLMHAVNRGDSTGSDSVIVIDKYLRAFDAEMYPLSHDERTVESNDNTDTSTQDGSKSQLEPEYVKRRNLLIAQRSGKILKTHGVYTVAAMTSSQTGSSTYSKQFPSEPSVYLKSLSEMRAQNEASLAQLNSLLDYLKTLPETEQEASDPYRERIGPPPKRQTLVFYTKIRGTTAHETDNADAREAELHLQAAHCPGISELTAKELVKLDPKCEIPRYKVIVARFNPPMRTLSFMSDVSGKQLARMRVAVETLLTDLYWELALASNGNMVSANVYTNKDASNRSSSKQQQDTLVGDSIASWNELEAWRRRLKSLKERDKWIRDKEQSTSVFSRVFDATSSQTTSMGVTPDRDLDLLRHTSLAYMEHFRSKADLAIMRLQRHPSNFLYLALFKDGLVTFASNVPLIKRIKAESVLATALRSEYAQVQGHKWWGRELTLRDQDEIQGNEKYLGKSRPQDEAADPLVWPDEDDNRRYVLNVRVVFHDRDTPLPPRIVAAWDPPGGRTGISVEDLPTAAATSSRRMNFNASAIKDKDFLAILDEELGSVEAMDDSEDPFDPSLKFDELSTLWTGDPEVVAACGERSQIAAICQGLYSKVLEKQAERVAILKHEYENSEAAAQLRLVVEKCNDYLSASRATELPDDMQDQLISAIEAVRKEAHRVRLEERHAQLLDRIQLGSIVQSRLIQSQENDFGKLGTTPLTRANHSAPALLELHLGVTMKVDEIVRYLNMYAWPLYDAIVLGDWANSGAALDSDASVRSEANADQDSFRLGKLHSDIKTLYQEVTQENSDATTWMEDPLTPGAAGAAMASGQGKRLVLHRTAPETQSVVFTPIPQTKHQFESVRFGDENAEVYGMANPFYEPQKAPEENPVDNGTVSREVDPNRLQTTHSATSTSRIGDTANQLASEPSSSASESVSQGDTNTTPTQGDPRKRPSKLKGSEELRRRLLSSMYASSD